MKDLLDQAHWLKNAQDNAIDSTADIGEYVDSIVNRSSIFEEPNLFDCAFGCNRYVKLSELFNADNSEKWKYLLDRARNCDSITIVKDISYKNIELSFIENFYLKVFYSELKKANPVCYIYQL